MKVFNAEQVRRADQFTIDHEPIASIDLMERASKTCFRYLRESYSKEKSFAVYCGFGNNGGDGYAAASSLKQDGFNVSIQSVVTKDQVKKEALFFYEQCFNLEILFILASVVLPIPRFGVLITLSKARSSDKLFINLK